MDLVWGSGFYSFIENYKIMKKTVLLIAISLLVNLKLNSQIISVSLDYKIENSPFIIDGQVIDAISKQDNLNTTIFTDYTVKVLSVSKGIINQEYITIRGLGGSIGESTLQVCPNSHFDIGDLGTYFISKITDGIYEPSFLGQSEYVGYKLEKNSNNKFELKTNTLDNKSIAATITSVSPLNVNAGIGQVITIAGTGFGTGPPSGLKLWVPRANLPGSYISQSYLFHYVSWTDTEIKYKVSSDAASGKIRVGFATTYVEATQPLNINFNIRDQFNANQTGISPVILASLNNGGIEFTKNTNFTNQDALNATLIAMDNWTCSTRIKLSINTTAATSNTNITNDGQNVLFFANLGPTVLGLTYSNITACSISGRSYVSDVDLGINSNQPFNYTLNPTTLGQYDYFNVILHELGHLRNLGHVGNTDDIMYPSLSTGVANRALNIDNIIGGLWTQNESENISICSRPLMTLGNCQELDNNDFKNLKNEIEIYPNPVSSKLYLNTTHEVLKVIVFDSSGRIIKRTLIDNNIDFSDLGKGVYLLRIVTNEVVINEKIIKN